MFLHTMLTWSKRLLYCALCITLSLTAREKIVSYGIPQPGPSLPFPVLATHRNHEQTALFLWGSPYAEYTNKKVKHLLHAHLKAEHSQIYPTLPEKIKCGETDLVSGELLGSSIKASSLILLPHGSYSIFVFKHDPRRVWAISNAKNNEATIAPATPFHSRFSLLLDAHSKPTSGIETVAASEQYVFCAVKPNNGEPFGTDGSGIVLCAIADINSEVRQRYLDVEAGKKKMPTEEERKQFAELKPNTQHFVQKVGPENKIQAYPLDHATELLWGSSAVPHERVFAPNMVMHWSPHVKRLYIGLNLTASSDPNDSVCAVLVGEVTKEEHIVLKPFIVRDCIPQGDAIVAAKGAGVHVAITHLESMITTTDMRYLIVVRDDNTVAALPMHVKDNEHVAGSMANINAEIEYFYYTKNRFDFYKVRGHKEHTQSSDQCPSLSDPRVHVGGGVQLPGPIAQVTTDADVVYVTISHPYDGQQPGVFSSTALHDNQGRIKGWTQWQRVAGTRYAVDACFPDPFRGTLATVTSVSYPLSTLSTLPVDEETEKETVTTQASQKEVTHTEDKLLQCTEVYRTKWYDAQHTEDQPVAHMCKQLNEKFTSAVGGSSGFTPLFCAHEKLLAVRGNGRFALLKCMPSKFNVKSTASFDEDGYAVAFFDHESLKALGPITSIAVGSYHDKEIIIIGGHSGLGYVCNQAGDLIDTNTIFSLAHNDITIKAIGNYKHVRNMYVQDRQLFVITSDVVDRIDLTQKLDQPTSVTLAYAHSFKKDTKTAFTDAIVSGPLLILGTNHGLYRNGNGTDIRTITLPHYSVWTEIVLPEHVGGISQLWSITKTGNPLDLTQYEGGDLYVLTREIYGRQSRVYRLSITPQTLVSNTMVQLFSDFFIKNNASWFLSCGWICNTFATDGSSFFLADSTKCEEDGAYVRGMQSFFPKDRDEFTYFCRHSGFAFLGARSLKILSMPGSSIITGMCKHPETGHWWIASDAGVTVNS